MSEKKTRNKVNDLQVYFKNQEVNQMNTSVNISYEYKITASPPYFFKLIYFGGSKEIL